MRLVDRRWPWVAACIVLFVAVMAFIQFMMKGINDDFGYGYALGMISGFVIVITAVGWRRGEMR
jgi:Na+/H+ antiporter NhaC